MSDDWQARREAIARYYAELVARHGADPRSCDYGRPESQRRKFEVLAEVMPLAGQSLLDVGCGLADYADFLSHRHPGVRYEGVDVAPAMIAQAQALRPHLPLRVADILAEDIGGPWDVVTANGIFYLLGEEAGWALMQRLVTRMFELCRGAVAFNSLSTWAPHRAPGEFQADPARTLDFCRTLTPWVSLRHDHLPHDFAVYLYRTPRAA